MTHPMRYRRGAVVSKHDSDGDLTLGHVEGFARNAVGGILVVVRWEGDKISAVHPSQITLDVTEWPAMWSKDKCQERWNGRVHKAGERLDDDKAGADWLSRLYLKCRKQWGRCRT